MGHTVQVLLLLGSAAFAQEPEALAPKGRIELPDVAGRIDHLSADVKGGRLFTAALGNHTVEVLDFRGRKRLGTIPGLAEPQGVFYDASTNRLFVACANDGTAKLFDAGTYRLINEVKFSGDADNIRFDARRGHVIVGYGAGAIGLLDHAGRKEAEIALDAHPESFQVEKAGTRVFINVPDRKEIEVADLETKSVRARWPVTSALKNYPMALDEGHHRLLIGCRSPARMLVFDTESGKQTGAVEIAGDTDDLFYDAPRSRVYVIGGAGYLDVLAQRTADRYERTQRIPTAPGARTGLLVPEWGTLFVAAPRRQGAPAAILVYEVR